MEEKVGYSRVFRLSLKGGIAVLNGILSIALVLVSAEAGVAEATEAPVPPPATVLMTPPAAGEYTSVGEMAATSWNGVAGWQGGGAAWHPCTTAKRTCCAWWSSTCDMHQHLRYPPPLHGNYYFRPYDPTDLFRQQAFVTQWGGDPRNPYDNEVFDRIHGPRAPVPNGGAAEPVPVPPPTSLLPEKPERVD